MFEEEIEISFFFRVQVLMRNWLDVGIDSFDHKRSINFYSFRVKKPSAYNIDKIMMEELCIPLSARRIRRSVSFYPPPTPVSINKKILIPSRLYKEEGGRGLFDSVLSVPLSFNEYVIKE
jgi:hypothetical protein